MDLMSTMATSTPSGPGRWDEEKGSPLPATPDKSRSDDLTTLVPVDNDEAHAQWSCRRKKQYPSFEIAEKIAAQINASSGMEQVRAYGCRHCGQHHVGSIPGVPRAQFIPPRRQQRRVVTRRSGSSYGSNRRRHKQERYKNREEEDD